MGEFCLLNKAENDMRRCDGLGLLGQPYLIREDQSGRKFVKSGNYPYWWRTLFGECGLGFFLQKIVSDYFIT